MKLSFIPGWQDQVEERAAQAQQVQQVNPEPTLRIVRQPGNYYN